MTGKIKRILYLLTGIIAGATAFAAVELLNAAGMPNYLMLALTQGAALGFIFGFIFGFNDGMLYRELKTGLPKALTAAAAGAITAAAAQVLASQGMLLTARLAGSGYEQTMGVLLPLWRGIGWMLMGVAIGAIDGIHKKAFRRSIAGILGGITGGLAGGLAFEFLIRLFPAVPYIKAAGLMVMGGCIGFSIGEFERRFSYARLKVLSGRLKDREYLLVKHKTEIGGRLQDDICIRGYETIPEGVFTRNGSEVYFDIPVNTNPDMPPAESEMTLLNDQSVSGRQALKFQDVIQLGNLKLLYLPL